MVTDHKSLEFFKMQTCLSGRQTRWMEYFTRFDFNVKGELNKVVDVLSRYFKHNYWTEVLEIQDYVNADVHLDPEHDDLPWECLFKVEEGIIKLRVHRANSAKVVAEIQALWECIQERDILAASIAASQQKENEPPVGGTVKEDPTVFESIAKGEDLCETMSHRDSFKEDICKRYIMDPWFQKMKGKLESQTMFTECNRFIWAQNRGGDNIVCIPSVLSGDAMLRTRILDQAHQVVGHYGLQCTVEYIRCWYWWPGPFKLVDKFCRSCETCATG